MNEKIGNLSRKRETLKKKLNGNSRMEYINVIFFLQSTSSE